MLKLLDIFSGRVAMSQELTQVVAENPSLAMAFAAGAAVAQSASPNWPALLQLAFELLPTILPYL
jgi:hypothetical protein